MSFLTVIYMVAIGAIAFIAGMVVELFIDNSHFVEIEKENERLKLEMESLRKTPEIIEIVDPWAVGSKVPEEISFPNTEGI